jgi:hypothetical protein
MFLLLIIAVFYGVFLYRTGAFWKWIVWAYLFGVIGSILFYGDGTLEDPTGDGIVTYLIRQATNDGGLVSLLFFVIIIEWAVFLLLIKRAFQVGKKVKAGEIQSQIASPLRKVTEFLVIGIFLLYSQIIGIKYPMNPEAVLTSFGIEVRPPQSKELPNIPSIETELQAAIDEMNKGLPQKIDEITYLNSVSANKRTMTYHYIVDAKATEHAALRNFVLPNITKGQCTNPEVRNLIQANGVAYAYKYKNSDSKLLFTIVVDEDLCRELGY